MNKVTGDHVTLRRRRPGVEQPNPSQSTGSGRVHSRKKLSRRRLSARHRAPIGTFPCGPFFETPGPSLAPPPTGPFFLFAPRPGSPSHAEPMSSLNSGHVLVSVGVHQPLFACNLSQRGTASCPSLSAPSAYVGAAHAWPRDSNAPPLASPGTTSTFLIHSRLARSRGPNTTTNADAPPGSKAFFLRGTAERAARWPGRNRALTPTYVAMAESETR